MCDPEGGVLSGKKSRQKGRSAGVCLVIGGARIACFSEWSLPSLSWGHFLSLSRGQSLPSSKCRFLTWGGEQKEAGVEAPKSQVSRMKAVEQLMPRRELRGKTERSGKKPNERAKTLYTGRGQNPDRSGC